LQVFDLAREEIPYDEEFLVAALLHDVGKAIDPRDPIPSALEALDGYISPRTAWLMTHLPDAKALRDGTLGVRSRRRLEAHDSFEELTTLARCDRAGRQRGVQVPRVEEALDYLRELASACG
jgi:predicted HD phosphohydrolase